MNLIRRNKMKNIFKNQEGVACIEFAFCFPILLLLLFGGVELSRYMIVIEKVEQTTSTMADITGQTQSAPQLTNAQFLAQEANLVSAIPDIMNPYASTNNSFVVITDVIQIGNTPVVNWQYCSGQLTGLKSKVGTQTAATASLPNGLTLFNGQEVVIAEVYYNFSPIITQSFLPPQTLYRTSTFMPRQGALTEFQSTCTYN